MEDRIRLALSDAYGESVATRATLKNLGGHASLRIYWRVTLPEPKERGESTKMAMVMPLEGGRGSEEASREVEQRELPFLDVHRLLKAMHLPVPTVDVVREDLGVLLLEDLGDMTFERLILRVRGGRPHAETQGGVESLYHRAINMLVSVQRSWAQGGQRGRLPESVATGRAFDEELLGWELGHYLEWGIEAQHGERSEEVRQEFAGEFERIVGELVALPQTLVLRDYQSRNIMEKGGKLVMIDFQDALLGPMVYDLVALLRDSYVGLGFELVRRLLTHYIEQGRAAGLPWCEDAAGVRRAFHVQTVQRKLKDAGRFVFIDRMKHNPDFLPYYAPSMKYVREALGQLPELKGLKELLMAHDPAFSP